MKKLLFLLLASNALSAHSAEHVVCSVWDYARTDSQYGCHLLLVDQITRCVGSPEHRAVATPAGPSSFHTSFEVPHYGTGEVETGCNYDGSAEILNLSLTRRETNEVLIVNSRKDVSVIPPGMTNSVECKIMEDDELKRTRRLDCRE